jgi:uncharacterized protein YggE
MFRITATAAFLLASASLGTPLAAQNAIPTIAGTRLDVLATGQVTRVPDIARINAGVVTQAPTATAAIAQNARQMASVRTALKAAGIADRDIQTSSINLNPDYRYAENRNPVLTGYRASNEVTVRFRDIANTGKILDALVAQGANQLNGPTLALDKPEEAMDEARSAALNSAKARAEMYARQLGKRVGRILSISETGGGFPPPMPMIAEAAVRGRSATQIDPGEQMVSVSLAVSFELE